MPVRPSTLTEKPLVLSITFGSGSENRSSMWVTPDKVEDHVIDLPIRLYAR
jgi:hypothetical protein